MFHSQNLNTLLAIYYFIYQTERTVIPQYFLYIINFSSQQIRNSLLCLVIERIMATIYLQRYKLSSTINLFIGLTIWSYASSAVYMVIRALGNEKLLFLIFYFWYSFDGNLKLKNMNSIFFSQLWAVFHAIWWSFNVVYVCNPCVYFGCLQYSIFTQ